MTYQQLENCYKTVLKQRDDAEVQLVLKDDHINHLTDMLKRVLSEQHKYVPSLKKGGVEHFYINKQTFTDIAKLIETQAAIR